MRASKRVRTSIRLGAVGGVAFAAAAALVPFQAGVAGAASKTPTATLRIAITVAPTSLPIWVAEQKGYFTKNHLAVTTTTSTNIALLPAAMGSQYDLAVSTAPTLVSAAQGGLPVVAAAGLTVNTKAIPQGLQLVVSKASGITSASQLGGATIGSPSVGGNVDIATEYLLKKAGVNLSTIKTVAVNQSTEASLLASRQVKAVEASQPALGQILSAGGVSLGAPFASLPQLPNLSALLIANKSWANSHKSVLQRFYKAIGQAETWIGKNEKGAYAIAAQKTGTTAALQELTALPTWKTAISPSDFNMWVKVMCDVNRSQCPTVSGKKLIATPLLALSKSSS